MPGDGAGVRGGGFGAEFCGDEIKEQIERVYAEADFVGSLVTEGDTERLTEYDGPKVQPADWWEQFWKRHEENTGDTPAEARAKLIRLLGRDYADCPVNEPYLSSILDGYAMPEGMEPPPRPGFFQRLFKSR